MTKWSSGICGVGSMLIKWKHQSHSRCPICNGPNETTSHVLQCPHHTVNTLWNEELTKLSDWMMNNDGDPNLSIAIIELLRQWRHGNNQVRTNFDCPLLSRAIQKQCYFTTRCLIDGFFVPEWRTVQHQYLKDIGSSRNSLFWMAQLARRIWNVCRTLWDHRNNILHSEGQTIHQEELRQINEDISQEWERGLDTLPPNNYRHLFRGTIDTLLNKTIDHKQQWLTSVWAARDKLSDIEDIHRSTIGSDFYRRWKSSITSDLEREKAKRDEERLAAAEAAARCITTQTDRSNSLTAPPS